MIRVNTVNAFAWQRGWFKWRAVRRFCAAFSRSTGAMTRMYITMLSHTISGEVLMDRFGYSASHGNNHRAINPFSYNTFQSKMRL